MGSGEFNLLSFCHIVAPNVVRLSLHSCSDELTIEALFQGRPIYISAACSKTRTDDTLTDSFTAARGGGRVGKSLCFSTAGWVEAPFSSNTALRSVDMRATLGVHVNRGAHERVFN